MIAHVLFAIFMFASTFVRSQTAGTALVALSGVSWAATQWAPYAIIGEEVAGKQQQDGDGEALRGVDDAVEHQVGLIMSLHNTAISVPQIAAALVCSGIFGLAKVVGSQDGVAWCFGAGGLATLAAALISRGLTCD